MVAASSQLLSGKPTALLLLRGETLRYVWRIPLVVGTLLTVVNQSTNIVAGPDLASLSAVAFNYVTPYVVSSLGFISYRRSQHRDHVDQIVGGSGVERSDSSASGALGCSPFEWIVNSNALGVGFLAKENNYRVTFLSRHAVRRLADRSLIGKTAHDLLGEPATSIADVEELKLSSLQEPSNYPAAARAVLDGRHIELAISSVTGAEGDHLGAMLTFKDITEAVQREQEVLEFKEIMRDHALSGQTGADQTEAVAGDLTNAVSTVHGNGGQIAQLIGQLGGLNSQTRMLSLNASIEAVRAGEGGSTFRVIADELGQLALSTKEVATEVETILNSIEVDSGVAFDCAEALTENVTSLIAIQRAMEQEVQNRG